MKRRNALKLLTPFLVAAIFLLAVLCIQSRADDKNNKGATGEDTVLQAMQMEMARSKAKLKLEQMAAPYYIEYRVAELDEVAAEAAFGAVRANSRNHLRLVRVVVRVGDYKQDSYFGQGEGVFEVMPSDDDLLALRHRLWLATDRAYKTATEALASKQAQLKQFNVEQPVDDFARAPVVESITPLAKLEVDPPPWVKMLERATALYKQDPQVQSLEASLHFAAVNRRFLNSEGTVVRGGRTFYSIVVQASTQAADGMKLERSHASTVADMKELPSEEKFLAQTTKLLGTLKQLRDAPIADEEFRGPVLFSGNAAASIFVDFIGDNVLGRKPDLGQPARTKGAFATSFKSRVLPDFLSVVDDPTVAAVDGHSLVGNYDIDDEGVAAARVQVVEKGKLENYLMGREPIRDFSTSNGHGR